MLSISVEQQSKDLYSLFLFTYIVCQVKGYRNILKLNCKALTFTSYKAFLKNKKRSGTSLPTSLSNTNNGANET